MRNIKVFMAYRGTNYHGFQRQENALTVQEVVEDCLEKILGEKTQICGCSRTDTGVHALEFCFNFFTDKNIPETGLVRGMNTILPDDISILSCEQAPDDFHARYSCKAKEYIYKIYNAESKNPFSSDLALHYKKPFDVELVSMASKAFIGTHDFKAFCASGSNKESTVRTVYDFSVSKNGNEIIMLVKGDGFLYNMVRIMVGTLLCVNERKIDAGGIKEIILSKNRVLAGRTAKPHGLYLSRVYY